MRAPQEFVADVHEALERFAAAVHALEVSGSEYSHAQVQQLTRQAHSLQAMVAAAGTQAMSVLVQRTEDWLQALGVRGTAPHPAGREMLQQVVDVLGLMFDEAQHDAVSHSTLERAQALGATLGQWVREGNQAPGGVPRAAPLTRQVWSALTQAEEARLSALLRTGADLWRVRAVFVLSDFEARLRQLTFDLAAHGEVVATVPATAPAALESIAFDVIFCGHRAQALSKVSLPAGATVHAVIASQTDDEVARPDRSTVRIEPERLAELLAQVDGLGETHRVLDAWATGKSAPDAAKVREEVDTLGRQVLALRRSLATLTNRPLAPLFAKLTRLMHSVIAQSGKAVNFWAQAHDFTVDSDLWHGLGPVLMHLLRNAVAHGAQNAELRAARSKPLTNQITLTAQRSTYRMVIEVTDDGAGLDDAAIARAAVERGMLTSSERESMSRDAVRALIFRSGFSTQSTVGVLSGRGVGLDVVKNLVEQWGGHVEIESEPGKGTTFRVVLPKQRDDERIEPSKALV